MHMDRADFEKWIQRQAVPSTVHMPMTPTTALPGTADKIVIMADRISRGEHPHHPDDFRYDPR